MDRWIGKVAVVTGASAGMGAAFSKDLVEAGMKVVGLARRVEKMQEQATEMDTSKGGEFFPVKCDVSKEEEIMEAFAWIKETLGGVDVMVNNAGITRQMLLTTPNNSDDLRSLVEINILALCFCTREAYNSMKERGVAGHIININSIAGHHVPYMPGINLNIYPGTKHCVTAMTEELRREMVRDGNRTKVTSISPGFVATEILCTSLTPEKLEEYLSVTPYLKPEDISQGLLFCLGTPEHVQVHELTIKPIGERF